MKFEHENHEFGSDFSFLFYLFICCTHTILIELLHGQFAALRIRALQRKVCPYEALAGNVPRVHLHQLCVASAGSRSCTPEATSRSRSNSGTEYPPDSATLMTPLSHLNVHKFAAFLLPSRLHELKVDSSYTLRSLIREKTNTCALRRIDRDAAIQQPGIVISHLLPINGSLDTKMAWQMLYPVAIILQDTHSTFRVHLRAHYASIFISNCDAASTPRVEV